MNGYLMDVTQAAEAVMLASLLVFSYPFLTRGTWYKNPVGWSVAIERASYVCLLGILLAQQYVRFNISAYLITISVLLLVAAAGISIGTGYMLKRRQ